jgi:hypothetical protein
MKYKLIKKFYTTDNLTVDPQVLVWSDDKDSYIGKSVSGKTVKFAKDLVEFKFDIFGRLFDNSRWIPADGENYFTFDIILGVITIRERMYIKNDNFNPSLRHSGLIFKSEAQARKAAGFTLKALQNYTAGLISDDKLCR